MCLKQPAVGTPLRVMVQRGRFRRNSGDDEHLIYNRRVGILLRLIRIKPYLYNVPARPAQDFFDRGRLWVNPARLRPHFYVAIRYKGGYLQAYMIIDFHTHIFPRKIREDKAAYFPSEPDFRLLYRSSRARLSGASQLIAAMDAQQVDRSVVFGFPWKRPETIRMHNDYVGEAAEKSGGRLIPFGCLDPHSGDAVKEAERCIENGFAGIGELAAYLSGYDTEFLQRLEPIMALCRVRNVPVLIHVNKPVGHVYPGKIPLTLKQILALASSFPDNRLVLAHWGGGIFFFSLAKKEVKEKLKNVYFDTAASPFLYDPAIYRIAVEIIGSKKILFGSDYPLLKPERYFTELKSSGLSPADVANISGGNAARLLNL